MPTGLLLDYLLALGTFREDSIFSTSIGDSMERFVPEANIMHLLGNIVITKIVITLTLKNAFLHSGTYIHPRYLEYNN